jgi:hypothetical protein
MPAAKNGSMPAANDATTPPLIVHPYATVSIKSHVPVTLEMKNSNYTKWASFFKSMCSKFGLQSHIDGSSPAHLDDPQWYSADCCVRTWLFGSVDDSVLDLAMEGDDQSARAL